VVADLHLTCLMVSLTCLETCIHVSAGFSDLNVATGAWNFVNQRLYV
jgi:hypothetical protein